MIRKVSQYFDFNGLRWSTCDVMFLLDSFLNYFCKSEMETDPNLKERFVTWRQISLSGFSSTFMPDYVTAHARQDSRERRLEVPAVLE